MWLKLLISDFRPLAPGEYEGLRRLCQRAKSGLDRRDRSADNVNIDSAEKPYECFDDAPPARARAGQHERKISNDFRSSSLPVLWQTGVRPEALEG